MADEEDRLAFFAPSLLRAHNAKTLLEHWAQAHATLSFDALVDQMCEASLCEASPPPLRLSRCWPPAMEGESSSPPRNPIRAPPPTPQAAMPPDRLVKWPPLHIDWPALDEEQLEAASPTAVTGSVWFGAASHLEHLTTTPVKVSPPPPLHAPRSCRVAIQASTFIDALDLARSRAASDRALPSRQSSSSSMTAEPMGREAHEERGRRRTDAHLYDHAISKSQRALRRAKFGKQSFGDRARRVQRLGLCVNASMNAAAGNAVTGSVADAALARRFGEGLQLHMPTTAP